MADFKITRNDELMHYRTKGSKNGVRLYQNPDGSLTPLGERHYRDMYGYGEQNSGSSKTLAQLRRERLNAGGKDRANVSSKNVSPEYLKELNYNSKKNEYPGQSGRSVTVAPNTNKNVKGAPQGKVFRDTSMGPTVLKRFADDPNEVREIGTNYVTGPQIFGKYDSKKADLYEDPRNFQKTPGDKTAPMYKSREDVKEKLRSEYGNNIPRDQYEAYMVTPSKDDVYNENGAHTRFGTTSLNRMNEARIADDKEKAAKEKAEKEKAEKEKAESLSGRLQSAYDTVSKAVVDTADKAKKGATDAYNSASKAVVDAADESRYAAERAYNSASNAVADAVRAVNDVKENFGPGVADVSNAVKEWVTTAADDVKKTASEAFDAGKEWVEQAGKDVGDFVNNAVSDVTKAVDDAKNGVVNAANTVGKAAQDGWNWVKNLFGGGDDYGKDEDKDRSNHSSSSHKM